MSVSQDSTGLPCCRSSVTPASSPPTRDPSVPPRPSVTFRRPIRQLPVPSGCVRARTRHSGGVSRSGLPHPPTPPGGGPPGQGQHRAGRRHAGRPGRLRSACTCCSRSSRCSWPGATRHQLAAAPCTSWRRTPTARCVLWVPAAGLVLLAAWQGIEAAVRPQLADTGGLRKRAGIRPAARASTWRWPGWPSAQPPAERRQQQGRHDRAADVGAPPGSGWWRRSA